jgi:hypothetical protein
MADRDIACVLITGAGASRDLAAGADRFPLMSEWSDALTKYLGSRNQAYVEATGLKIGLDGPSFEEALGAFLQESQAFRRAKGLVSRTLHLPGIPSALHEQLLSEWYQQSSHSFSQITNAISESLYIEFGNKHIDQPRASAAYAGLLEALGIEMRSTKWVYATTNYDKVAEVALKGMKTFVDDGVRPGPYAGSEAEFDLEGLVSNCTARRTPLLHLHGRIGWYRREDGSAFSIDADQHDASFGSPIVMLPDLEKVYSDEPIVQEMWTEFREALRRARKVFIVGHSLHDEALLQALELEVSPTNRIAIGLKASERRDDIFAPGCKEIANMARERFGSASFPLTFGGALRDEVAKSIRDWSASS